MEGIGSRYGATLAAIGIKTTDDLLDQGASRTGRGRIATQVGVSTATVLDWVNRVDLARIKGVAGQYADLLERTGVDTPAELARRNPDQLTAALADSNAVYGLVRRVPSRTTVARWIREAKALPRIVEY